MNEEQLIANLLSFIGENVDRDGIKATPRRVLESYKSIFSGYQKDYQMVLGDVFSKSQSNDLIKFDKINFFSTCEHHFIPFFGQIKVIYMPSEYIVGIGRIVDLVKAVTRKLQVQERIAFEIATTIQESNLKPRGVFVEITAQHLCSYAKDCNSDPNILVNIYTTGEFTKQENLTKLILLK